VLGNFNAKPDVIDCSHSRAICLRSEAAGSHGEPSRETAIGADCSLFRATSSELHVPRQSWRVLARAGNNVVASDTNSSSGGIPRNARVNARKGMRRSSFCSLSFGAAFSSRRPLTIGSSRGKTFDASRE